MPIAYMIKLNAAIIGAVVDDAVHDCLVTAIDSLRSGGTSSTLPCRVDEYLISIMFGAWRASALTALVREALHDIGTDSRKYGWLYLLKGTFFLVFLVVQCPFCETHFRGDDL